MQKTNLHSPSANSGRQACANCSSAFTVTDEDLTFYDKVSPVFGGKKHKVPLPKYCPVCRKQRRLTYRNERTLFRRKCDLCKKDIISLFPEGSSYKAYCTDSWWSDDWDPLSYGQEYDFSKSFFDQFGDLLKSVPHMGSGYVSKCENCEYCNYQNDSKDCYLTSGSGFMQNCAYTSWTYYAQDSYDLLGCDHCEKCYELVDCRKMYGSARCQDCSNCTDCLSCFDCHGCTNCYGCVGLRQKQYCFLNGQLTKEEYEKRISTIDLNEFDKQYNNLLLAIPRRASYQINCENCIGDHLANCKNVREGFYLADIEDCTYSTDAIEMKDCYDCDRTGINELVYECVCGGRYNRCISCVVGDYSNDCYYSYNCFNVDNLFGCVSLNHKEYCILNKQYTKEEYESLVPKIIEHMQTNGEWGEFFPAELSPFAYNETLAQEYFPMTKKSTEANGWLWREKKDEIPEVEKIIPGAKLPSNIDDIPDDILNWAVKCEVTGRPFKIQKGELEFYRSMEIPIPHFHPDERHKRRMDLRTPRKLWDRTCDKCSKEIKTAYSPERPEKIYCEDCYLAEVY